MGKKKGGKGKGGGGGGGDGDGGGPSRPPTEQQQRAPPPQQSSGASEPFNVGGGAGGEGGGRGRGRGGEGGGRGWGRGGGEGRGRGGGGRGEGGRGEGGGGEGRGGGGGRGGEGGGRAWGRGDSGGDIGQPVSPPEYSLPGPGEAPRGGRGGVRGFGRGRGGPQAGEQRTPPDSAGLGGSGFTYGQPQTPPMQQHQQQQQQQQIQEMQQQVTQKPAPAASQLPATAEITQKMSKMDVAKWKLPERKKNGTRGRKIELELNHFELSFKNKDFIAIHYDVSFKPDKPRRMFRTIMEAFRRKKFPNNFPAFDGRKNLYSAKELPFGMSVTDSVKVFNDERYCDVEYEVTVKFASKVDMSQLSKYLNSRSQSYEVPQDALQAVDIVLRNPAALTFVGVGRSFFTKPEQIIDLGDGLELWFGFYQSAILGWKPFLNVDVAHKGFPMGERLLETLCRYQKCQMNDIRNIRNLDRFIQSEFEKYIKGLKVEYQIPQRPDTKRVYKVNKLVKNSIEQRFIFEKDNKKLEMTVGEYFQREKKYTLQYPYLPLVHIGPQNKEFFVPLEMCCITRGQALNRKLNPDQTSVMVKNAAKPPDERRQKIAMALRKANFNNDKCVQEFGITVSDRFAQVTGRVLEPPTLEYNKQQVKPAKGVWRSGRFLQPVEIRNWAIINCDYRTNDGSLQRFSADMAKNGQSLGINIVAAPRIIPFTQKLNKMSWLSEFKKTLGSLKCGNNQMEIVIVVIPDKGDIYPMVKQTAELSVGILTQCIKSKTMYRMNPATIGNILLKVNSKLNGVNHKIGGRPKLLQRPAMIMGADVTHPSPDQTNIPSVAAVSASHDANGFMYNMMWRLQAAKSEIIVDLQNIVAAQLKFFYQKTRCKPETIYFFRDGVSEGMFTQVLSAELTAIRKACRSLNENYKPGITFLVVQKRHHTRFFPRHDRDRDGKWGNVPAGTIVDTQVTHKTETDFYLVSHASIQGTARPTKYHLLWDDNDIDEDDLEELTYNLCHMFTRCTRSVSYPAPTYYAHLAAFRARVYLEGQVGDFSESNLAREMEKRIIDVNFHRENPMFFV